jgi:aminopeptidase N
MHFSIRRIHLILLPLCLLMAGCGKSNLLEPGVSLSLAEHRKTTLSEVAYSLAFSIPEEKDQPLTGTAHITFTMAKSGELILDFRGDEKSITRVDLDGAAREYRQENGHIVVKGVAKGVHEVEIDFISGNQGLNRQEDYLYTLFVPDKASTAFPCFDQPNIKATYTLQLEVPSNWEAVANGALVSSEPQPHRTLHRYETTEPISTYLFSFAVGKFQTVTQTIGDNTYRCLHRETDSTKVTRNMEEIFTLHHRALEWMQAYTAIPYPFKKLDFVLIPAFQYGGMEHPGAILYNAQSLFLEANATQVQELGRAALIGHEVAHMWFGNLVTMDWFNDVWLKEVFANFMADLMVRPNFPEIDHELRFLMAHYPAAMAIDRSKGSHPIQQPLDNLSHAGTLYGPIIYQKAPIMMRQLALRMGEEAFQKGLQHYLSTYAFSNATWDQLIDCLEKFSEQPLQAWSHQWVKMPGMPKLSVYQIKGKNSSGTQFTVGQYNDNRKEIWSQNFGVGIVLKDTIQTHPIPLLSDTYTLKLVDSPEAHKAIIPNVDGMGYGNFVIGENTRAFLMEPSMPLSSLQRGVAWITLWEDFLQGKNNADALMEAIMDALVKESEPLIVDYLISQMSTLYWRFLSPETRNKLAPQLEGLLVTLLSKEEGKSIKPLYFRGLRTVAISKNGVELLRKAFQDNIEWRDFTLSLEDRGKVAMELALREVPDASDILSAYGKMLDNPDQLARWQFILPALDARLEVRERFFTSLKDPSNRQREAWVLDALRALHHPLRAESAIPFLLPSLQMMEELRQTGDIFFSKRWMETTLSGHSSQEAADVVRNYLFANPRLSTPIKNQILQASDILFRVEKRTPKPGS